MSQRFVIVHQHYDAKDADANLTSALSSQILSGKYSMVDVIIPMVFGRTWYHNILDYDNRVRNIVDVYHADLATTLRVVLGHNMALSVQLLCLEYSKIEIKHSSPIRIGSIEQTLPIEPVDTLRIGWLVSTLFQIPAKCDQIDIVHCPNPDGKTNYHCDTSTDAVIGAARPYVSRRVCYYSSMFKTAKSHQTLAKMIRSWTTSLPEYKLHYMRTNDNPTLSSKTLVVDVRPNKIGLGFDLQTTSSNIIRIIVLQKNDETNVGYIDCTIYDDGTSHTFDRSYSNPTHQ